MDPDSRLALARLIEWMLAADALIQVRKPHPTEADARLDGAVAALALARRIPVLAVEAHRSSKRSGNAKGTFLDDIHWRRDLGRVKRALLSRYGAPDRPGPEEPSMPSRRRD